MKIARGLGVIGSAGCGGREGSETVLIGSSMPVRDESSDAWIDRASSRAPCDGGESGEEGESGPGGESGDEGESGVPGRCGESGVCGGVCGDPGGVGVSGAGGESGVLSGSGISRAWIAPAPSSS